MAFRDAPYIRVDRALLKAHILCVDAHTLIGCRPGTLFEHELQEARSSKSGETKVRTYNILA